MTRYRTLRRSPPIFSQLDEESCGFLAALAVARRLKPSLSARRVEAAVPSGAHDTVSLSNGLRALGFRTRLRWGLTRTALRELLLSRAVPLVTVWPDWSPCDHWTAVWLAPAGWARLSNYCMTDSDGWLQWSEFRDVWYYPGESLVVRA